MTICQLVLVVGMAIGTVRVAQLSSFEFLNRLQSTGTGQQEITVARRLLFAEGEIHRVSSDQVL